MLILALIYFIAMVAIAFLFGGKRNVKIYAIKLVGILFLIFSLVEYVVKLSNYHSFMQIDYSIYLKMLNFKIIIYTVSAISNFSIVLLIFSGVIFTQKIRKINLLQYLLIGISTAVFLILNSNTFSKVLRRTFSYSWSVYENTISLGIRIVSCVIVIAWLLLPYISTLLESGQGDGSRLLKKYLFSNSLVVLHTKFKHTTTIYSSNQIVFFKNPTF